MKTVELAVVNPSGLHARPAKTLVALAKQYTSAVSIICGAKRANAKSMIAMLTLGATKGSAITLEVDGPDEDKAIADIEAAIRSGLGDSLEDHGVVDHSVPSASAYQAYQALDYPLPKETLTWNLYGAGLENLGHNGAAESFAIPEPSADQLLVRVDSIGMCFSDIKILSQGGDHPKLYHRNLAVDPTRLGHEVALTVVKIGANLAGRYKIGERLAVQPDIYQNGISTAYGYTVPGGMTQYHLIGAEVLQTDAGACLLPVAEDMGYAESSLLEPWGCVLAAYTQRRRLTPKSGGRMWIVGRPGDATVYAFSHGLEAPNAPAIIVLTDVSASTKALAAASGATLIERNGVQPADYAALSLELTGGTGFDDIVLLDPVSAAAVSAAQPVIARRGTCALVGDHALDGLVKVDFGRLHYDYIALLGARGPDIAAAYGVARNRCELKSGGLAVFVGAGGPMGQMHVQRALELPDGPRVLIATDVSSPRLETLRALFAPLAVKHGREIIFFNPRADGETRTLRDVVSQLSAGHGADDVVVSVPFAGVMEEAATLMNPDGMLVLFAGVPNGTMGAVDLSQVFLANAQFTGTSGLTLEDQALVMERRVAGALSPGRAVAAIGGMETASEALASVIAGKYAGKIVIFPQLQGLPLTGLAELKDKFPDVAAKLGEDLMWTKAAEAALIEHFWKKPV